MQGRDPAIMVKRIAESSTIIVAILVTLLGIRLMIAGLPTWGAPEMLVVSVLFPQPPPFAGAKYVPVPMPMVLVLLMSATLLAGGILARRLWIAWIGAIPVVILTLFLFLNKVSGLLPQASIRLALLLLVTIAGRNVRQTD